MGVAERREGGKEGDRRKINTKSQIKAGKVHYFIAN